MKPLEVVEHIACHLDATQSALPAGVFTFSLCLFLAGALVAPQHRLGLYGVEGAKVCGVRCFGSCLYGLGHLLVLLRMSALGRHESFWPFGACLWCWL